MGSFSGPGVCIEFIDMSTLMSIRMNVMCLGESRGSGRKGDKMGGESDFSGERAETIGLFKAMNESRDKQRTHVLRDLPLVSFASGGGRCWSCQEWRCVAIPQRLCEDMFPNWAWSSGDK
jgi:hypothetical protein